MNQDRYTQRSQGLLQAAQMEAVRDGHQQLTPWHLLNTLIKDPDGLAAKLMQAANGETKTLLKKTQQELEKIPKVSGSSAGQIYLSQELALILDFAEKAAEKAGDNFVTVEMLLLALSANNPTKNAFEAARISPSKLNEAINSMRKGRKADSANAEDTFDALNRYARD